MKAAIVIPTLNAVRCGFWQEVLTSIAGQTFPVELKVIVDSHSSDQTREQAASFGWKCLGIHRKNFNHGLIRTRILHYLRRRGFDTVIFLSQDAVLTRPDALETLIRFLRRHSEITGCYGRQISLREHSLNAWQRQRCYPEQSRIQSDADIKQDGLMAAFCSNAFSAWRIDSVLEYGGFEKTAFGEDMLLAAKVLSAGGKIGYCAEAAIRHEHADDPLALFQRGFQVGWFHRTHPELLKQFGSPLRGRIRKRPPFLLLFPLGIKFTGYLAGRYQERLLPWLAFLLIWLLLLPLFFLSDFPKRDVAFRYAPMAEAFAAGEWRFAFHPRVTPLLPVCAGILVQIFSCSSRLACQLAATLFLSLGLFPLYAGCRRIYGFRIAALSAILPAGCSYLIRLGYYGLRESGSLLGILLIFYAVVLLRQSSRSVGGFLCFALGETLLLLSRGDVALFGMLAFSGLFLWDCVRNGHPLRTFAAGVLMMLLLLPQLAYNYRMIGYPVPELRHAVIMRSLCKMIPGLSFLRNPTPEMALDIISPGMAEGEE